MKGTDRRWEGGEEPAIYVTPDLSYDSGGRDKRRAKMIEGMNKEKKENSAFNLLTGEPYARSLHRSPGAWLPRPPRLSCRALRWNQSSRPEPPVAPSRLGRVWGLTTSCRKIAVYGLRGRLDAHSDVRAHETFWRQEAWRCLWRPGADSRSW